MDIFTDIPTSTYPSTILVVVDRFLKILVFFDLRTKTGIEVVAHTFFNINILCAFIGFPILSSQIRTLAL